MNWKLVVLLSLFGLAMAIATVFVIPSKVEPLFWLAIFLVCAWLIATRAPGRPFLHGLATGVVNSIWVTGAHVLLFSQYAATHAAEMDALRASPMATSPRLMMAITGPIIGVISGCILGLFAMVAAKLVRRQPASATPA